MRICEYVFGNFIHFTKWQNKAKLLSKTPDDGYHSRSSTKFKLISALKIIIRCVFSAENKKEDMM